MDATPRILSESDAADLLQIATARLRKLARGRKVPCIVLPDGDFLFDERDLREWLNARKQPAEGEHAR